MDFNTLPPSPYAVDYPNRPVPELSELILALQTPGRTRFRIRRTPKAPSEIVKNFLLS